MRRTNQQLSDAELKLRRLEARQKFPVPAWGDHVLRGFQGRTAAKPLSSGGKRQAA